MDDDARLLRRFTEEGSQEAFAALTKRHLSLVYAVCRRELHSNEAAEDAAQAVFLLLAQKANTLRAGPSLAGWLFQTARFVARNARTQAARRAHYEGKATAMQTPPDDNDVWADIEPLLNSSLAALPARDREGVLLRFFQGLTFAEMGSVLGLSEEAARKRVGRGLEKMRRFFDREGVTLPAAVLPALLSAHTLRPVPDHLAGAVATTLAGAVPAQVSLITQGVLHSMKFVQIKLAAGAAALLIAGTATYVLAQTGYTKPSQDTISLAEPINAGPTGFTPGGAKDVGGAKDAVRNVLLTGRIRYEDGRPAGGVQIDAHMQNKSIQDKVAAMKRQGVTGTHNWTKQEQEESWNETLSKSDGSYTLPVGANISYNVIVSDTTGKWVAAAVEGASGPQNSTVKLSDLILTHGAIVTGMITNTIGRPQPGVYVCSYGPSCPRTTAAAITVPADSSGRYQLRVAPGVSNIYVSSGPDGDKTVTVAAGTVQTVDLIHLSASEIGK